MISLDINYRPPKGARSTVKMLTGVRYADGTVHGLEDLGLCPECHRPELALNGSVIVCLDCGRAVAEIKDYSEDISKTA